MTPDPHRLITIAGAGLAGALLATLLAQRGWRVEVFEKRGDPRRFGYEGGRSINLALAERGLHALREAGLTAPVMAQAVMMRGRMVHAADVHGRTSAAGGRMPGAADGGEPQLLRYGKDDSEVIWSVHRGRLNISLLEAAEAAGATLHFNQRVEHVELGNNTLTLVDDGTGMHRPHPFAVLIGADGAGSGVRQALQAAGVLSERFAPLGHGYKELEIPPAPGGGFALEPNALHIWPRGRYMCIALPNTEQTFTVTLFLPLQADGTGTPTFADLPDAKAAHAFFARDFPDALALVPDFDADWSGHPIGNLSTLYVDRWRYGGEAVLLGDAAHAMVPFHGQGMNCAFEDCLALVRHIEQAPNWDAAFAGFEAERKPNAEAIQAMALENYVEMRDKVDDPDFLLQRQLERVLAERHPGVFVPRYSMVSFLRVPYSLAFARGQVQRQILVESTAGLARLDQVDLDAADKRVLERLAPLDA
jgi:kynurenine 3-monooxygenase